MSEKEIRDFLAGNTIGSDDFGPEDDSLEYHDPNGRALWFFQGEIQRGFYRVKGSTVCYTYEGPDLGSWFCWEFKRDRRTGEVYQWHEDTGYKMRITGEGDQVTGLDTQLAA